jgi:hypothetical protein
MLKSVKGLYQQGQIKLPAGIAIPPGAEVVVTFDDTNSINTDDLKKGMQSNDDIEAMLQLYRQENRLRPIGLAKGEFIVPDDFNEPLPDEILELFEGKEG